MEAKQADDYRGNYVWNIQQTKLTQMVQTKNKEAFDSDAFEMASMTWCIQVYPNGYNDNNVGSFHVCLKVLSLQKGTKILAFKRMYCKEYNASYSNVESYKKNTNWAWPNYTLSLNEIKTSNLKELTVIVNIQILRIINESSNGNEIIYQHNMCFDTSFSNQ
eukprot:109812_1